MDKVYRRGVAIDVALRAAVKRNTTQGTSVQSPSPVSMQAPGLAPEAVAAPLEMGAPPAPVRLRTRVKRALRVSVKLAWRVLRPFVRPVVFRTRRYFSFELQQTLHSQHIAAGQAIERMSADLMREIQVSRELLRNELASVHQHSADHLMRRIEQMELNTQGSLKTIAAASQGERDALQLLLDRSEGLSADVLTHIQGLRDVSHAIVREIRSLPDTNDAVAKQLKALQVIGTAAAHQVDVVVNEIAGIHHHVDVMVGEITGIRHGVDVMVGDIAGMRHQADVTISDIVGMRHQVDVVLGDIAGVRHQTEAVHIAGAAIGRDVQGLAQGMPARLDRIEQYGYAAARRVIIPCGPDEVLLKTEAGYVMCPVSDRSIIACLADTGDLERGTRLLIQRALRPGDVFVDVGANLGIHTLAAAVAMQGRGKIIAFEPFETTRRMLEETVRINGYASITEIHQAAVSDNSGRQSLYLGKSSGHHSLYELETADAGSVPAVEVNTVRLDDVISIEQSVNLIKIDAEGAELAVLDSAGDIIGANPNIALIVEFGPSHLARNGQNASDWLARFATHGLIYRGINPTSGELETWSMNRLETVDSINLLFARPTATVWALLEAS